MGGYKTPASATTAYLNARKKLMNNSTTTATGTVSESAAPTPSTPRSTGKKRAATQTPADSTAKKRARKSRAEVQAVATTEADEDDEVTKNEVKPKIKGENDAEDDGAGKVLNGAQDFLDANAEVKAEGTEDA